MHRTLGLRRLAMPGASYEEQIDIAMRRKPVQADHNNRRRRQRRCRFQKKSCREFRGFRRSTADLEGHFPEKDVSGYMEEPGRIPGASHWRRSLLRLIRWKLSKRRRRIW